MRRAFSYARFSTAEQMEGRSLKRQEEAAKAYCQRNGLTLEELSARCIQLDSQSAPSVSYLSMIESGKRVPSEEVLGLLLHLIQRPLAAFDSL